MINETTEFGWTPFVFGSLLYEQLRLVLTMGLQKVTSQSGVYKWPSEQN